MPSKKNKLDKRKYSVLETVLTFGASYLVKEVIKKTWEKTTDKPAPEHLNSKQSNTKEVILFAFSLALVSASIKLFTRKGLSEQWKKRGGELPSKFEDS